ncbi:lactate/malate family dehydrogenase [Mycobacterium sp.]|jgi:L-lactate dehydrogenase|uniref:lactate/malate family dehydrogenase n=1 Tax=Mycobacterium sp. TaxID=1785 RepID=UPI002D6E0788|nr:lactate dehydrogenase [Mycobacterium sp.]HZA12265.1 lactate dehydrogenase [Mycobacterium sp.]
MKVGIIGAGAVGAATGLALIERQVCRDIVLIDSDPARASGTALDLRYAAPLTPAVEVSAGDYDLLTGAELVIITAGVNERAGGAIDRSDPQGRLRLAAENARIYAGIVPMAVQAAPQAVLMVVTDPPDPLADITRGLAGHSRVFSTGTLLDSLRFRVHLAQRLAVQTDDVSAMVVGEHGTSQVLLWSSATVAGRSVLELLGRNAHAEAVRRDIEDDVRFANIAIIEGTGASRYGIAAVAARLAAAVLRDERVLLPVGVYHPDFGTTLSLPSVVGADGVRGVIEPAMTPEERRAVERSAAILRAATEQCEEALDLAALHR